MSQPIIAVVNNDALFVQLLTTLLKAEGFAALRHQTGDVAYTQIKEQQPDAILLDIEATNPLLSWRVVDFLLFDPQTASIPLVIASVNDQELKDRIVRLEAAGCRVIEKPFVLDDLLSAIRSTFQ